MFEIKLNVRAEILATLKLFTADKGGHNYLKGINLEIGCKETLLVATDGHILGCFRVESNQPGVGAPLTNIIIPSDLLKPIKPTGMVEITIGELETKDNGKGEKVPASNARPVTLTHAGLSTSGKTLDGKFPDFRHAIPSSISGQPAQFDPRLVGTLAKAWATLHSSKSQPRVGIGYNGNASALFTLGDENFVGVIAPMRPFEIPIISPFWVQS